MKDRLSNQLSSINITIAQGVDQKFMIDKTDVRKLLKSKLGYDISLEKIGGLNLYELEGFLEADSRINRADIYVDKRGRLNIDIKQRQPIVRVSGVDGLAYYLDYKGERIPITETVRVPIVTGNVDAYKKAFKKDKANNHNEIIEVSRRIYDDEFLYSLIEQIHIDEHDKFILIPKIGTNKIIVGEASDLDSKFYRLNYYYKNEIKDIGFNKFDEIDIQYAHQVVGRDKNSQPIN